MFSLLLYNLSIRLYWLAIYCASFFNKKARLFLAGRNEWESKLRSLTPVTGKRIWIHCSSLGEFEQALPVIELLALDATVRSLKDDYTNSEKRKDQIIVTFFSPSGYEVRKNNTLVDFVMYLPLDTKQNAKDFLDAVNPDVALFVKYDFWYHYLHELKQRNIPVILFSAVFREKQIFFKSYGSIFRKMLPYFSKIFVQSKQSSALLNTIGIHSEVAFDTRFDRVHGIAKGNLWLKNNNELEFDQRCFKDYSPIKFIQKFKGSSKILVAGSTWKRDEELIVECINRKVLKEYKYIIAPHNINQNRIDEIIASIKVKAIRFSELNDENATEIDVVIIDSIGQLSTIYAFGEIAYIGGGFNASVHNILEAAVYGIPVLFGPNFKKSLEAEKLLYHQIDDYTSLTIALHKLSEETERVSVGLIGKKFIEERLGGAERVVEEIRLHLKS